MYRDISSPFPSPFRELVDHEWRQQCGLWKMRTWVLPIQRHLGAPGTKASVSVATSEDAALPQPKRRRQKIYGDTRAIADSRKPEQVKLEGFHGQRQQDAEIQKPVADPAEALAKELLTDRGQVHAILSRSTPRQKVLTRLISFLTMSNQEPLVLQVLDWVDEQDYLQTSRAFFYSKVLTYLSEREGPKHSVVQLNRKMQLKHVYMDKFLYNNTISALGKAGEWRLCLQAYADMRHAGYKADVYTYSSLIQACQCCGSRWKQAVDFFEEMKLAGVKPNVITFTTLISCCQRAGQWKRARQYFTEMEQEGIRPDVKAYNSLLSACSRGARWEEAWDICSSMRRSDVQPNVRTYNALISACSRAGEPERALEAYRRMERGYVNGRRLVPTLTTINTLMSACAKGGMFDIVVELYESLQGLRLRPDVFTLTALITVCKACDYWEEALSFAEEFSAEHGIEMNTLACNALIATLGRAGRWQYALQVFDRLSAGELDGKPDAWTHSALCLAFRRGEQHQAVMEVYRMMKAENMLVYKDVFYAVLEACERLGLWREGRDVLQDIQANETQQRLGVGLDVAAWQAVFAFPPLMDSVPKPIIAAARAAVSSGRAARRLVGQRRVHGDSDEEDTDSDEDTTS